MKYPDDVYLNSGFYGNASDGIEHYHQKIVKTRKNHKCAFCQGIILKGEHALAESGFMNGGPVNSYTCLPCIEKWLEESGQVDMEENNDQDQTEDERQDPAALHREGDDPVREEDDDRMDADRSTGGIADDCGGKEMSNAELADAYLDAYLYAINKTSDVNLSTQAAFTVCLVRKMTEKPTAQTGNLIGDILFRAIINASQNRDGEPDNEN